jgi:hypothetical protein
MDAFAKESSNTRTGEMKWQAMLSMTGWPACAVGGPNAPAARCDRNTRRPS